MACRKAADRALMQLGEWRAEQEAKLEPRWKAFVQEQYPRWMGDTSAEATAEALANFENTYCVKWLVDGAEVPHDDPVRSGCSGGCGKAHPRITLDWCSQQRKNKQKKGGLKRDKDEEEEEEEKTQEEEYAVAYLSHDMAPFQNYFETLTEKGLAQKEEAPNGVAKNSSGAYRLSGFLPTNLQKLKQAFGPHLVKLASLEALAASERAHQRQVQQQEETSQRNKKQRTTMPSGEVDLLERALQVCCDYNLIEHLTVAELAFMKCTCNHFMAKLASSMIQTRMQRLDLSYSLLVDGLTTYVGNSTTEENDAEDPETGNINIVKLRPSNILLDDIEDLYVLHAQHRRLLRHPPSGKCSAMKHNKNNNNNDDDDDDDDASSVPGEPPSFVPATRESQVRFGAANRNLVRNIVHRGGGITEYKGHLVRLYLKGSSSLSSNKGGNTTVLPESDCLFSNTPLEVTRYYISISDFVPLPVGASKTDVYTTHSYNTRGTMTYEMAWCADPDEDKNLDGHYLFRILSIQFDFQDIVAIYARKKLPLAKAKLQEIKQQRPVTRIEKDYVKALARMVRNAPGSAQDFSRLEGW